MKTDAWTASKIEEVIGTLWLIASLLAALAHIRWLAVALFFKASMDMVCAIKFALAECRAERKLKCTNSTLN